MQLQQVVGFFSLDSLQLIDTDTNLPVKATFANAQFSSDNPAVLTSAPSAADPNTAQDTGIAPGNANVTAQADCTYIDSKSNQQVTKTLQVVVPYSVVAPAAENVALTLVQGQPQPVPPAAAPAAAPAS